MKTAILKSVLCVAILFASALNMNLMAQEKFVTNDVMTGDLVTSKIIYRQDGALYRHMKHDFKYDDQNRVVEKETFKWDSNKEEWMPYCKIDLTYTSDQVVLNYGKWNKKSKAYNEAQERNVYELDGFNIPIAYQNYKWNGQNEEWKIVEDLKFSTGEVFYAIN
ncbi:DUF3836 domain-containing protein [Bacteroides sp. 51]|uniref:DUF3836 domain-containing protein n=1 Tax=Bacteroides sp. 51 TaxID=2302938 RepID=UPI0013D5E80D|nr:DUF3836 domain-containing protein [Bacteroides sp. 51]